MSVSRNVAAMAAGFGVWLGAHISTTVISVLGWRITPENHVAIGLASWVGTSFGLIIADPVMQRIAPALPRKITILSLATLVLAWLAASILTGTESGYKLASLLGTALAAVVAYGMATFGR